MGKGITWPQLFDGLAKGDSLRKVGEVPKGMSDADIRRKFGIRGGKVHKVPFKGADGKEMVRVYIG